MVSSRENAIDESRICPFEMRRLKNGGCFRRKAETWRSGQSPKMTYGFLFSHSVELLEGVIGFNNCDVRDFAHTATRNDFRKAKRDPFRLVLRQA